MLLSKAVLAHHFNRLVEALVHLCQGVHSGFGAQNLDDLLCHLAPHLSKPGRLVTVGLTVRVQQLRNELGRRDSHGVVEEECKTWNGNLLHGLQHVWFKRSLQNLCVDGDQLNGGVLFLQRTGLDTDDLALERNELPAFVLFNLVNLILIIQQLNVCLGGRNCQERRHDSGEVRDEVRTQDSAHPTPAVEQVLRLRVVRIDDVLLDVTKQLHEVQGILTHLALANGQRNQRGTLHGLGTQQAVLLGLLLLQNVKQQRHQGIVVMNERSLSRVGNRGNRGQGLLLHVTLLATQKKQKMLQKIGQIGLKNLPLCLLTEVDQSCGSMGLNARFWAVENRNDVGQHDCMVFLLHRSGEIGTHLAQGIATSIPDTRVGVLEGRNNQRQHLVEFTNHNIATSLRDGGDGHESRVAVTPGGRRHHAGNPRESGRENNLTTQLVGQTVHALFTGNVVEVALFQVKL